MEVSHGGEHMEEYKSNTGDTLNPNDAGQKQDGTLYNKADKRNGFIGVAMNLLSSSSSSSIYCKIPSIRSRLQIRLTDIEPVTDSN
jgi:hypothetical protein